MLDDVPISIAFKIRHGEESWKKNNNTQVQNLADQAVSKFAKKDWEDLAERIGFTQILVGHPQLLKSLEVGGRHYREHAIEMLNQMVGSDPANYSIIYGTLQGDDTKFFDVANRYKSIRVLGTGGYGEVHFEYDTLLDMNFARKDLAPSPFANEEVVGRFLREARLLFKLSHPNIVRIYEVGRIGVKAYIRMEYIDGKTLDELGKLSHDLARNYVVQILLALQHAHGQSVIHRDLKPRNIIVDDGSLKVIDFGLGAFVEANLDIKLTPIGSSIGGGCFAAPEFRQNPSIRDERADIFSVGALWYFMLSGRYPGGTDLTEVLQEVGEIPRNDLELIIKCMAAVDKRPASASEVLSIIGAESPSDLPGSNANSQCGLPRLTQDELIVLAAFLKNYPFGTDLLTTELRKEVGSLGLVGDVRLGAALSRLNKVDHIRRYYDEREGHGWALTADGVETMTANSNLILKTVENWEY